MNRLILREKTTHFEYQILKCIQHLQRLYFLFIVKENSVFSRSWLNLLYNLSRYVQVNQPKK